MSSIGEMLSHSASQLNHAVSSHAEHSHFHDGHSHDFDSQVSFDSSHHDASNHTHETVYQITMPQLLEEIVTSGSVLPFLGAAPNHPQYRIERPPKRVFS